MSGDINELLSTIRQADVLEFLQRNGYEGIHCFNEEKLNAVESEWVKRHRKDTQSDIVFYFTGTERLSTYVYRVVVSLERVDTIKYRKEHRLYTSQYEFNRSGHLEKEWTAFLISTYGKLFIDYYHHEVQKAIEDKREAAVRELNEYAKKEWTKFKELVEQDTESLG